MKSLLEFKLISEESVAEMLGITTKLLKHWRSFHKGPPFIKIAYGQYRYDLESVVKWLKYREVTLFENSPKAIKRKTDALKIAYRKRYGVYDIAAQSLNVMEKKLKKGKLNGKIDS